MSALRDYCIGIGIALGPGLGTAIGVLFGSTGLVLGIVIGGRGLHQLKSFGSVSERVAPGARWSVLSIREPAWQRIGQELAQ